MATDYDAPRVSEEEVEARSVDELTAQRKDHGSGQIDVDEGEVHESYELPGADLSGEALSVHVVPLQPDEFTCSSCFLVHHRSQLVRQGAHGAVCSECD